MDRCVHAHIMELRSLIPRPIRLQLNARLTSRPGIDCIWAWLEFAQTSEFLSVL